MWREKVAGKYGGRGGEYGGREVAGKSLSRKAGENGGKTNARLLPEHDNAVIMHIVGA
jgi:hypothetical protein